MFSSKTSFCLLLWLSSGCAFTPNLITKRNNIIYSSNGVTSTCITTSTLKNTENENSEKSSTEPPAQPVIEPLKPFIPALDPMYKCRGLVGEEDFTVSRIGEPTKEELSNENLYKILMIQCSDLEVNTLVWKCMGYRFDEEKEEWNNEKVFPKWREKFPSPPDLIGMQRIYSKEVDQPSLKANQQLVRSVPVDNKQSLKTHLRPLGFTGYKYAELTPNKTRRAQCANWLLFYREELFGFTVEELRERRRLKLEAEEEEKKRLEKETGKAAEDEWKPPVKEVF
mmetsp:Transcript_9937/g.11570  ORF Transcript_9937/g.11570 Transcript_9937/m.11570 type:complete len:282 (+) Transcript_9937:99-944(+)